MTNQTDGSTGNRRSPSEQVRLDALAAAAGCRRVTAVTEAEAVGHTLKEMLSTEGPHFLLVKVTDEVADRFRTSMLEA